MLSSTSHSNPPLSPSRRAIPSEWGFRVTLQKERKTHSHLDLGREKKKTRLTDSLGRRGEERREEEEEEEEEEMEKSSVVIRDCWFLVVMFWIFVVSVASVDDKCGACNAVAEELEIGLSNEKPRNHLDMRHRLDSKGQREGKVIDYRVSDLRVVDLLDGLCENMLEYTLEKLDSTRREWIKVANWDRLNIDKQEARAHSKQISSYCGRLLEETEDELAELIKKGSVRIGGVSKVLCQDLSHHCSETSTSPQTRDEDDDDDSYRDL